MPHLSQQLRRWLIEWADRNDYNIYADGLVVRTTIDSRLQDMANKALTAQADRLQKIVAGDWRGRGLEGQKRRAARAGLGFCARHQGIQGRARRRPGRRPGDQGAAADAEFMQTLKDEKTRLQAGFMALDPTNGQVRAWVGSRDFADDQFDHVQQARRQPGSTFKPFVYGAAFEDGARPSPTA
jgi:penicillin-binding protein 1A